MWLGHAGQFAVALQKMWLGNGEWMCIYHILMISYISRAIWSGKAAQSMWNSELKVLLSVFGMYHVFHSSSAAVGDISVDGTHLYFTGSPMVWRRTVIRVKLKHSWLAIQREWGFDENNGLYFLPLWIVERWSLGWTRDDRSNESQERGKLHWDILA